ncbi:glutamate synthase-related protein [Candidatus Uabimicrobium amorphum]|uniref:FMN-binding glutamate synthase family protein n=1 Tax=Uabimicrobium amorphum TaxID=2596890 RepID=A0A5S9ISU1_UABAM|nr:glutamate synthase-related protein [Candidatus Uabimicrobium amorphum]BBM87469.1 FMN-binding glutamate synthase family protein [Candidatus Uabimicrobium amorphum]
MRREFVIVSFVILAINAVSYFFFPWFLWSLVVFLPIIVIGTWDMLQDKHAILKNFPIAGHFRYWLEMIRPEINQYFIESNQDGVPFSREQRSLVYQRAKKQLDTLPFGTQGDVYSVGYEWVNHSLAAKHNKEKDYRVVIGSDDCKKPYSASIFNISAMSYGSLSKTAVLSLNAGAKIGGFAHNTGEGGISPYHLEHGGDLIWQIGTGYFGCRTSKGDFCEELFAKNSQQDSVKMIEIKLSQGAKPGHGGILPAAKVTEEISKIRNVPMGQDVLSPPGHKAFHSPMGLLEFVKKLRELSGGKPVGFKLCLGRRSEFLAICKAMVESGITPDFITVDGGEGGTGAAPLEFSNHIGCPLREAQIFVHNALVGFGVRDKIKLVVSGKVISGFDIISRIAVGADLCYSARGMMLALGCIQALRCNSNDCPSGVATQKARFYKGVVVADKKERVANYHKGTIHGVGEILGAMGLEDPSELKPYHLVRRVAFNEIRHYGELYEYLQKGDLLGDNIPDSYKDAYERAQVNSFAV